MFDSISNNISNIFDKITSKNIITQDDIDQTIRQVRIALIEADVSLQVIRHFTNILKEKAAGQKITQGVKASEMIIKLINDELVELLGQEKSELNINVKKPAILMLVGLQGVGKTTACVKIANFLQSNKKQRVLMASLDTSRPAAMEQLAILGSNNNIDTLEIIAGENPTKIAKRALNDAKENNYDIVLLDTAGRLNIDSNLMNELQEIKKITSPDEIILTCDALIGQEAANIAKDFNDQLNIDSIILTKADSDSRAGGAISMKFVANCDIKFLSTGEKINDFQQFDPKAIASRILGMGDVVSLVEKAQEVIDEKDAKKMEKKLKKGNFDLEDLLKQLKTMQKMGGLTSIVNLLPGAGKIKEAIKQNNLGEKEILKQQSIIYSMTPKERSKPDILNSSRKRRIALGAGVNIVEINRLLKKFKQMQKMVKKVGKMDKNSLENMLNNMPR